MTPNEMKAWREQLEMYRLLQRLDAAQPAPDTAYDSRELLQRREADEPLVTAKVAGYLAEWFAQ